MSQYCAICASTKPPFTPQPLGRNNALVPVCAACDEPIFARTGPDRSYEPTGTLGYREISAAADRAFGDRMRRDSNDLKRGISTTHEEKPPGWIVVNVSRRDGNGKVRDNHAAYASLQCKPWGRYARPIGLTPRYFVFARPPEAEVQRLDENPLEAIERYRKVR